MRRFIGGLLLLLCSWPAGLNAQPVPGSPTAFADFVEPSFPFLITTVEAGKLGAAFPARNLAVRGIVMQLGNGAYACFDPDLLRMAVGWHGDFVSLTTMAQVSYHEAGNKDNDIPVVLGEPVFATGLYPGWMGAAPVFADPRPPGPNPDEIGRGPIDPARGRWNGLYVAGNRTVLSYTVQGTDILEQPGSVTAGGEVGITRTFSTGRITRPFTLVVAEVSDGGSFETGAGRAVVYGGKDQQTVTAVAVVGAPAGARVDVLENRYVTVHLPAGTPAAAFRVVVWKGARSRLGRFAAMQQGPVEMPDVSRGGPAHWPEAVTTQGRTAPPTEAYVIDELTLPIPNPWRRNVRVADVDFFPDGRAALVTFEGDVWIVSGIDEGLARLSWRRFASGLYEPLSLNIVDGAIYVFDRTQITRFHDLNADGEADFYENFSNLAVQSGESREYPLGMVPRPGGGFYLAKGGALDNGPKTAPAIMRGFRAGSQHSGTILEVSPDGRSVKVFASGFREPYLGIHPETGLLTASDQEGNFVPSTPIYVVREGRYYGVPATAHRDAVPDPSPPVTWIPHHVDQSGAGQVWITGGKMGLLDDALIHFSYGQSGAFRIFVDSTGGVYQGGLIAVAGDYPAPVSNGAVSPVDGQLYMAGFQIYGSKARQVSGFTRLRYTGLPSTLPVAARAGKQGVLIRFEVPLAPENTADLSRFSVQRWNYRRSERYGSGHFKPDGEPGQEAVPVSAAHLSRDGKALLLILPEVEEVMQMEVGYRLERADGAVFTDSLYLTLNRVSEIDLAAEGFAPIDWRRAQRASVPALAAHTPARPRPTAEAGRQLYERMGCITCHSVDGTLAGKTGPTFLGLHGSERRFMDGRTRKADAAYLAQSIVNPSSEIVEGYHEGMPNYTGVLSEDQIQSLVLFIQSLGEGTAP